MIPLQYLIKVELNLKIMCIFFLSVLMTGCDKSKDIMPTDQAKKSSTNKPRIKEKPITLEDIKAFKSRIANRTKNGLKQRSTISISDLVLNTEADFNYTYSDSEDFTEWDVSRHLFTVPVDGENVDETDADTFYDAALAFIAQHYNCHPSETKAPQLYDISYEITLSGASVTVTSIIGTANAGWSKPKSFSSGDDWHVYTNNCAANDDWRKNAATEISRVINYNRRYPYAHYFTNVDILWVHPGDSYGWGAINTGDVTPGDGIKDYLEYHFGCGGSDPCSNYSGSWSDIHCIEYGEMNWYMSNFNSYISAVESGESKNFIKILVYGDLLVCTDCNYEEWHGDLYIGTRHNSATLLDPVPSSECP